jgi:hypothetical protein
LHFPESALPVNIAVAKKHTTKCTLLMAVKNVYMESKMQGMSRAALITEMHLAKDMIDKIVEVRVYAICKSGKRQQPDVVDLIEYFTNFPFDWGREVKVLLSDAADQYEETLKNTQNEF